MKVTATANGPNRIETENECTLLAGGKRCRIVKEVFRLTTPGASDLVMEIACGLHNLRVDCRHPAPVFNRQSLLNPA